MIKEMIVSGTTLETKVAILEDDQLAELYIERNRNRGILANTYKGRVTKVLPGMQSAFVNIGLEKDAFLYVSDFVEDSEECEQVFSAVDDQMDTVTTDIEVQERPQRRERKAERSRWREKKERMEASRAPSSRPASEDWSAKYPPESWDISAETEREVESHVESNMLYASPDILETILPGPSMQSTGPSSSADMIASHTVEEKANESDLLSNRPGSTADDSGAAPLDSASIRDDGETMAFADVASKPGAARRRTS